MTAVKRIKLLVLVVLMLGLVQSVSLGRITAHSGGTDEYGCHSGSQAYHCHPKTSSNFDQRKYYKINGLQSNGVFKIPSVRFSSCVHLNRRFLRGVSGKRVKNQDQALLFSKKLYAMNRHLDLDKDGDKKESMKKAAADKKKGAKKEDKKEDKKSTKKGGLSKAQEKLPEGLKKAIKAGVRD